tara:strand:+ start:187 stop:423 length:237 start_codon:yes stop_codon:yes gene_type:complete
MPDIMKYEIDFKKLQSRFFRSIITLDEYVKGLNQLMFELKKQALYPLQSRTDIGVLLHSNHSLKLYKMLKNELAIVKK